MIQFEPPPSNMPLEWQAYFVRTLKRIAMEVSKDPTINKSDRVPSKAPDGTLVIFDTAIPNTQITSAGLWICNNNVWTKVSSV